jgi:hypothetical protein
MLLSGTDFDMVEGILDVHFADPLVVVALSTNSASRGRGY